MLTLYVVSLLHSEVSSSSANVDTCFQLEVHSLVKVPQ